ATSAPTALVPTPLPQLAAPTPTVTGTAQVGVPLTSVPGTWGPGSVTKTYQWLRDGTPIAGATGSRYTPTAADLLTSISVAVTGTRTGYQTATRTSTTQVVAEGVFTNTTPPAVPGDPAVGS